MSPQPATSRLLHLRRRVRRTVLARRRLLAAVAAAAAVAAGLRAASPPAPPTTMVLTAAHDLAGGTVVAPGDLARVPFTPASVPDGALGSVADAVGRTTTVPVRAGEAITDVRLLGGSILAGYPGTVAAPVRIADAGVVALLRVGDRVDVIGADPQTGESATVASDVPVIAAPEQTDVPSGLAADGMASGGLVVLAVPETTARALAGAGVSSYLTVAISR